MGINDLNAGSRDYTMSVSSMFAYYTLSSIYDKQQAVQIAYTSRITTNHTLSGPNQRPALDKIVIIERSMVQ